MTTIGMQVVQMPFQEIAERLNRLIAYVAPTDAVGDIK